MADKFILKRSSILGKRPTNQNLDPGEIALNTNSDDPGAFFEVSNGNVVKIGPTSVSLTPPVQFPEMGESWLDLAKGTLNIGNVEDAKRVWRAVSAPFLGGGGTCVFLAPEFPFSSDGLSNDGQSLPFQTLTRAILELSKHYLNKVLAGFPTKAESNRYTVFIAPSTVAIDNNQGVSVNNFSVDFSDESKKVSTPDLVQFNPATGGVVIPFGITLQGMDLKKSSLSPSHVPSYRNPGLPAPFRGVSQPITSILKCSGNTYLSNFSVVDKNTFSNIVGVSENNTYAVFKTEKPHGLKLNDAVQLTFSSSVDQSTGTFSPGQYYCIPLDTFSFYLSTGIQGGTDAEPYVAFTDMPITSNVTGPKFSISLTLSSAHRLRVVSNTTLQEVGDYFTKVQKAFSTFFGGQVTDGIELVNSGDYQIVGPASSPYPGNLSTNTTENSSLYANQVNLRSQYGMCWGEFDGAIVEGFKSVVVNACTAVSLQNDPSVYEIYTTLANEEGVSTQKWWNLTEASYLSLPAEERPDNLTLVPREAQLQLLNSTPINNIRYYYGTIADPGSGKSIGIVNTNSDFRHFGFRVTNGAYAQLQSIYTIGTAVGVWSLNGGVCNLTNSTSNFGSVSFKAEGFLGINSIGGANANAKGFVLEGIKRPLILTKPQTESVENKKILSIGAKITNAYIDPADPSIQILELGSDFSPGFILPYSLKPGSAIWVETQYCTFRGFFAVDGGPTLVLSVSETYSSTKLRLRSHDSTIPNDPEIISTFGIPYIRRFQDPRTSFDRSYSFYLKNTSPTAVAPQVGYVLRLNQTSQQLGSVSLRPNVQFDPGPLGGWGRVFTVDHVETGSMGSAPQFNYVIADTNQDLSYFVAATVSDYSRPWRQGKEFKNPKGYYTTHRNRNWYSAENNLWDYDYYGDSLNFNSEVGPYSLSPFQPSSPFVDTSVMEKQEPVSTSFQGTYAADSYLSDYLAGSTYMRGATSPYPTYPTTDCYDDDDGSEDMGLCLKDVPDEALETITVKASINVQSEQPYRFKTSTQSAQRYRPAIMEFSVLSTNIIPNPKQKVSVLLLSDGTYSEYVRVIGLSGSTVRAIRLNLENSAYISALPTEGTSYPWPIGTFVRVCGSNSIPEGSLYDPDWTMTKSSMLRFFEIMGYSNDLISPLLEPKTWGERVLPIASLSNILPEEGYAIVTDKWPLEFNQPSTVIANTHTWAYTGYYNYSRGLLKYQTTDITRKLASDFQASTAWSGRLTVTGVNDKGEIVQFGPQRQALTANYFDFESPVKNLGNSQIYENQQYTEFPSQVTVYSADDISSGFDGSATDFNLTAGGISIPPSQLLAESVLVVLGAVVQKPNIDYLIYGNTLSFTTPPPENTKSNIRIITSGDSSKTLVAIPLELVEGSGSVFTAAPINSSYSLKGLEINANNTFVIVGGVEQIPMAPDSSYSTLTSPWAYTIDRIEGVDEAVQIIFSEELPSGVSVDIRVFTSGYYWSSQGIYPVSAYSLDSISELFNGETTSFNLTYRGYHVNPTSVTFDNLIVSLGGAVQIPGSSYTVSNGRINFLSSSDAPASGTTINLRLITNSEFISCQINGRTSSNFIGWGAPLILNLENRVGALESSQLG